MGDDGFHRWRYRTDVLERVTVLPDGCRDVLVLGGAEEPRRVVLTDIDFCPRIAVLPRGREIVGYRLRPGAVVSGEVLEGIAAEPERAGSILRSEVSVLGEIDEAIGALATPGATLGSVSKALGASTRSVQRQFLRLRLPPPDFWRRLARARRAARLVPLGASLADIACDCGFADQAHMTRDFTQWFGATPAQVRRDTALADLIAQPALGDWTGEQISTR